MGKYDPLARLLEGLPDDRFEVELSFGRLDDLVGGLPPSSRRLRTWWANNSQSQSLAWHRSGWHVSEVDLASSRVVFARGRIGGTYATRTRSSASHRRAPHQATKNSSLPIGEVGELPVTGATDVRVIFAWRRLGFAVLDTGGRVAFPARLPSAPGLYRLRLTRGSTRARIYIGESKNLRTRLGTNYRNPGPKQQTSLRINTLLMDHLRAGGDVTVDVTVEASVSVDDQGTQVLDLERKAPRMLAENAALVTANLSGDADL